MQLSNNSGAFFELNLLNYETPDYECTGDPAIDGYAANSLMVDIVAVHPHLGKWTAKGPFLTVIEVEWMAEWLTLMGSASSFRPVLSLPRSKLRFDIVSSSGRASILRIFFTDDFQSEKYDVGQIDRNDSWLELDIAQLDHKAAAASLRGQLEKWPMRCGEFYL